MTNIYNILILNGASTTENAPGFVAIVQKIGEEFSLLAQEETVLRGGSEHFPIFCQRFFNQVLQENNSISVIVVIVGPGSFTGLRASISLALGLGLGLQCPVIGVRRGEALFPFVESYAQERPIWHVSYARQGRVFVESSCDVKVIAASISEIPLPTESVLLTGESAHLLVKEWGGNSIAEQSSIQEANALMIAQVGWKYFSQNKKNMPVQPVYIDAPEAKIPLHGLRAAPL